MPSRTNRVGNGKPLIWVTFIWQARFMHNIGWLDTSAAGTGSGGSPTEGNFVGGT